MVPKLKYEHVPLTSFSKMRVNMAAEIYYADFPSLSYNHTCTVCLCVESKYMYVQHMFACRCWVVVSKARAMTGEKEASEISIKNFVQMMDCFF